LNIPKGKRIVSISPYSDLPSNRFWRSGVTEEHPLSVKDLYRKKFEIDRTTRVVTAGSCFAQHIGRRLKDRGFGVLDHEPPPPGVSSETAQRFGYDIYSARYGNIYLVRQLLQLVREALGQWQPTDVIWTKENRFYDALRPNVEPDGLDSVDELQAHRSQHLAAVRRLLSEGDLWVFTLGLTEGWVHRESQTVYPTAPGTIAGSYDPDIHAFKNFTFSEILEDFLEFRTLVHAANPAARFLLTVSPVPLTATASDDHVLVATTHSKAVLRAVAGQLSSELDDVDYFPSFEIIASPWSRGFFYESTLRSVSAAGVDAVMRIFFAEHDPQGTAVTAAIPADDRVRRREARIQQRRAMRRAAKSREDVVCEESMLEAFSK
jgi:GSCFA family